SWPGPSGFPPPPGPARPPPAELLPARRRWLAALAPLLGALVALAVSLPLNGQHILNLPRVEVQATAWDTFKPLVGLAYSVRAVVDDLIPGVAGMNGPSCPVAALPGRVLLLAGLGVWWWWRAPHRRLLLLGLGFVFLRHLLIF